MPLEINRHGKEPQAAPSSPSEAGEITSDQEAAHTQGADIAPEKIHIRGLDNLTTDDIYAFAATHYPAQQPTKIEWIDDMSANIVYPSTSTAGTALRAFTHLPDPSTSYPEDPLDSRPAKPHPSNPTTQLSIRLALLTDKKAPRAGDASRFYLLNPDKDPREQRRRQYDRRDRRPYPNDRRKRRRSEEEDHVPFDENMYDDGPTSLDSRITRPLPDSSRERERNTHPRRRSPDRDLFSARRTERESYSYKRPRREREDDLFAAHPPPSHQTSSTTNTRPPHKESYGRLRDRSASPLRDGDREGALEDGDGRHGFAEAGIVMSSNQNTEMGRRIRRRSFTPPSSRARNSNSNTQISGGGNAGKELFANAASRSSALNHGGTDGDLFPNSLMAQTPLKATVVNGGGAAMSSGKKRAGHHRSDAFDAGSPVGSGVGSTAGAVGKGRDLFARIGGASSNQTNAANGNAGSGAGGFSIRGGGINTTTSTNSGARQGGEAEEAGFSIRGLGANHKRVKELFPERTSTGAASSGSSESNGRAGVNGKGGRDLFEGRLASGGGSLEGRITGRRRAEDLFL